MHLQDCLARRALVSCPPGDASFARLHTRTARSGPRYVRANPPACPDGHQRRVHLPHLETPERGPRPPPLTVAASHPPPVFGGPARAPAQPHQRAHEVVATQLLPRFRSRLRAQGERQSRAQQHQCPGEWAGVHGGRRPAPAGTPSYRHPARPS